MTPDSIASQDRLLFYPSRIKLFLLLLGAMAFVVAGVSIGKSGVPAPEVFIAFFVGVPFFAACGLYAAYRLLRHRPSLEIDSMGITDSASAIGIGWLSWADVDYVVLYTFYGRQHLGIIPRDVEGFMIRQNAFRRFVIKMNLRFGCAPANISDVALPIKVAELAELLHTRYGVRVERETSGLPVATGASRRRRSWASGAHLDSRAAHRPALVEPPPPGLE
jgi:hypothetical protein